MLKYWKKSFCRAFGIGSSKMTAIICILLVFIGTATIGVAHGDQGLAHVMRGSGGFEKEFFEIVDHLSFRVAKDDGSGFKDFRVDERGSVLDSVENFAGGTVRVVLDGNESSLLRDTRGYFDNKWFPGKAELPIKDSPFIFRFKYGAVSEYYNERKVEFTKEVVLNGRKGLRLVPGKLVKLEGFVDSLVLDGGRKGDVRNLFTCLDQIYSAYLGSRQESIDKSRVDKLRLSILSKLREAAKIEQLSWEESVGKYIVSHSDSSLIPVGSEVIQNIVSFYEPVSGEPSTNVSEVQTAYTMQLQELSSFITEFGGEALDSPCFSLSDSSKVAIRGLEVGTCQSMESLNLYLTAIAELREALNRCAEARLMTAGTRN